MNVENIDIRSGFSESGDASLPPGDSVSVVPSGAVRAMLCSSDDKGNSSLIMHPMPPGVPSKVFARSGSAS